MILAIDIGNTTVGIYGVMTDSYTVMFHKKLPTDLSLGREAYQKLFVQELDLKFSGGFEGAVISSVVPPLTDVLKEVVLACTGISAKVLTIDSNTLLKLQIENPKRLGIDRLVDATWAAAKYPLPVITVDMGTATTINVIDQNKNFLGGMIAPGVATAFHALAAKASQLYEIPLEAPSELIGKNTTQCMQSGAVIGAAAMIDGMVSRIEASLGSSTTLLITGGLAGIVEGAIEHPHTYDPELLVKGMAYLWKHS